jgi:hypothetical protein
MSSPNLDPFYAPNNVGPSTTAEQVRTLIMFASDEERKAMYGAKFWSWAQAQFKIFYGRNIGMAEIKHVLKTWVGTAGLNAESVLVKAKVEREIQRQGW